MATFTCFLCLFNRGADMAEKTLDPACVSIALEDSVCNASSQDGSFLTTHLKKVENHITDAQRFSHLPKRSAVDIKFIDLSYSVREGSWWRKRGKMAVPWRRLLILAGAN
uniref:Uncharacterized protein n=1 Tax=Naja naja TaxID=35670 RepID=A0A8C6Y142_NAJNA